VDEFPPVPARRATERVRRAVALITRGGRVLLAKRNGALLHGLWEPPGVDLAPGEDAGARLAAELERCGVRAKLVNTGRVVKHAITHRSIEVEVWRGSAPRAIVRADSARGGVRYVDLRRGGAPTRARNAGAGADAVPLTALARKLAGRLR
jgi:ADP-ribose pyrophosphatase YjhB (NUDIX family)